MLENTETIMQDLSSTVTLEAQLSCPRRMSGAIWDDDCHPAWPLADASGETRVSADPMLCFIALCSRYSHVMRGKKCEKMP